MNISGRLATVLSLVVASAFSCATSSISSAMSYRWQSSYSTTEDVEGQPLAAQVRRLQRALKNIGQPLPRRLSSELDVAVLNHDAVEIQKLIDSLIMAEVTIADDGSIAARKGLGKATLRQNQHTALLIKIVNRAGLRKKITVSSPNHGAVYGGASLFSLRRQQQTDLGNDPNEGDLPNRFLDVSFYRQPPMLDLMSGLTVEYAVLLIYCQRQGVVETHLNFEIPNQAFAEVPGPGEPFQFQVSPAAKVMIQVVDPTQFALHPIARVEIRDFEGRIHPLPPKRLAPDLFFQPHIYRRDGESIYLSSGEYTVRYCRGPEYRMFEKKMVVHSAKDNILSLELKRWVRPMEFGFLSGDHHIHAAGCSHYTSPTQGISPADMYRQVSGEGLNVGCVLTWGPCFDFQRRYFKPAAMQFSDTESLLKYDLEISGFGSQAMGHVCLLNLKDQAYPQSNGTKTAGWPTWTTPVMRWAKAQGGYTGYAHSASGLSIDPANATSRILSREDENLDGQLSPAEVSDTLLPYDFGKVDSDADGQITRRELMLAHRQSARELPNLAIPEMNGVGAMEICVSAVEGVCDFISCMDTSRIQEWNTWYHLLNCGFPIKVSGETDFPCMSSRRVGKGRVYVQMDLPRPLESNPIDFSKWCRRLAQGKSYVSDGFAHAIDFRVNQVSPGYGDVHLPDRGVVDVVAQVVFAPRMPASVAQGTQRKPIDRAKIGDTVELHHPREDNWVSGRESLVEIVVNGQVVASRKIPADGETHHLRLRIPVDRSSWIALRQFPQLHTNPVNVLVAGQPIRASRKSAKWCAEMTKLVWLNRQRTVDVKERSAAQATFVKAIAVLEQLAEE